MNLVQMQFLFMPLQDVNQTIMEDKEEANRGQGQGAIIRANAAIGQPTVGDEVNKRAVLHAAIDNPDTIAVVCAEVLAAEQALVDEEKFKATQAKLEVARMSATLLNPPSDDTKLKGVLHGSINLYGNGNLEEDDMEQENVLAIDEFTARTGGKRKAFGPQSSLAHYLGQLPPGDVVIVHNEVTPQGHFITWSLTALSKVLCLCTIAQTAHQVILVRKSLVNIAFGTGFCGKVLAQIGIHASVGSTDPQDADSPKDKWDNLIAFNATNTRARKIQKNELNTIEKGDLSANDYTLKIKAFCESLSFIGVTVDDDDKMEACLHGLGNAYNYFKTSICTRENIPYFLELSSLLVVEERSFIDDGVIQTRRNSSEQALYADSGRGRGRNAQRGGRGNQGQSQQQNQQNQQNQYGQQRPMRGRG
ncbi:hypothetical protein L7F22_067346 [Adiantum nelumboides]|nr:hypothetical protein [Adiantum nelumboides]